MSEDLVTRVEEQRNRYQITINDTEVFTLTPRQWRERGMEAGEASDLDEFRQWLLLRQYPDALDRAGKALSLRARSRGEIEQMLRGRAMSEDAIEMVLYKLDTMHLLNDDDFAQEWARSRVGRQVGKSRILQELLQKGVERQVAEDALGELDEDDLHEQRLRLAQRLLKRHQNEEPRKAMEKIIAAMMRRGFRYSEAAEAVQEALHAKEESEESLS